MRRFLFLTIILVCCAITSEAQIVSGPTNLVTCDSTKDQPSLDNTSFPGTADYCSGANSRKLLDANSGSSALKPAISAYIQYVSSDGNDSNDGLSWASAKATIDGALCALTAGNCTSSPPVAGNGTVYFADGVSASASNGVGIWLANTNDPNYPNLPKGWMASSGGFSLICASPLWGIPIAFSFRPSCRVFGGTSGANSPLLWLSGTQRPIYIEGLQGGTGGATPGHWGNIGVDSNGLVSAGANPATAVTIVASGGGGKQTTGNGPGLLVGNGYWLHIRDCDFGGNSAEIATIATPGTPGISRSSNVVTVTTTATHPFVTGDHVGIQYATDPTFNGTFTVTRVTSTTFTFAQTGPNATSGNGFAYSDRAYGIVLAGTQISIKSTQAGGGPIKFYGFANSNLDLDGYYMEGNLPGTNPPELWLSNLLGRGGRVYAKNVTMADTQKNVPAVYNEGGIQTTVEVSAGQNIGISGNATIIEESSSNIANRVVSPARQGQSGFFNGYLSAPNDTARRGFQPVAVRFANLAATNPVSWTGTGLTITSGQTAPDGTSGAGQVRALDGQTPVYFYNQTVTLTVNDYWIGGVWARSTTGNGFSNSQAVGIGMANGSGNLCHGARSGFFGVSPVYLGDGQWFWISAVCKIWANPSSPGAMSFTGLVDSTHTAQFYAPVFVHIPAGTISDNEAYELAQNLASYPETASVGEVSMLRNQYFRPGSTKFSALGTPSNGVFIYCSDCTVANPCASGGTGALAKRLNSVWVCN